MKKLTIEWDETVGVSKIEGKENFNMTELMDVLECLITDINEEFQHWKPAENHVKDFEIKNGPHARPRKKLFLDSTLKVAGDFFIPKKVGRPLDEDTDFNIFCSRIIAELQESPMTIQDLRRRLVPAVSSYNPKYHSFHEALNRLKKKGVITVLPDNMTLEYAIRKAKP